MLSDFTRYLKFLSNNNQLEIFTGYVGDLHGEGVIEGWGLVHGDTAYWEEIFQGVEGKACVHLCLNRTNLRGRQRADIEEPRVICVDIDQPIDDARLDELILGFAPNMVVESSAGKFHFYWRIDRGWRLVDWTKISAGIGALMGGDMSMCQVNKTIRAPGMRRVDKNGVECTPLIVHEDMGAQVWNYGEWVKGYPGIVGAGDAKLKEIKEARRKVRRGVKGSAGREAITVIGRNEALFSYMYEWCNDRLAGGELDIRKHGHMDIVYEEGFRWNKEMCSGDELGEDEVEKTCVSALYRAQEKREEFQQRVKAHTPKGESGVESPGAAPRKLIEFKPPWDEGFEYDSPLASISFSDAALIERFMQEYGERVLRVDNRFFGYDGSITTWSPQTAMDCPLLSHMCQQVSMRLVKSEEWTAQALKELGGKADNVEIEKMRNGVLSFGKQRSFSSAVINSGLVKRVDSSSLDRVIDEIQVANGLLNMDTGELRTVQASDMLSNKIGIPWDPTADYSRWLEFLMQVFENNTNMVNFMQELFGYSISGSVKEERLFMHIGVGGNGKSRVLRALRMISGSYGTNLAPDEMSDDGTKFERLGAHIESKRVGIIEDLNTKAGMEESFIKNVTAEEIRARGEHEKSREVPNRCVIHAAMNALPERLQNNKAVSRRLEVISYMVKFESITSVGQAIDTMIKEDAPGILRWAVEGFQRWKDRQGLDYTMCKTQFAEFVRETTISVADYLEKMYEVDVKGVGIDTATLVREVQTQAIKIGDTRKVTPISLGMLIGTLFKFPDGESRNKTRNSSTWKLKRKIDF